EAVDAGREPAVDWAEDACPPEDPHPVTERTRAAARAIPAILRNRLVFVWLIQIYPPFTYLFKEEVIRIVRENYMNYDLNVSFIADALNKNLDYVSRTFKKTTKIGLLDYIHLTRIARAKELLTEKRNMTVLQISSIVGYLNCDSFIRTFKQKEGMTPGKYRETHT
ncbi:helix-turn-helix transcriptional regulator, partial [Ruminococcaceae bacterium OttesenSCG-928-L11]|nr:helix-turn-helix transcriptional regulator [Ruminococcaceae bacterium OttesenSCG-928-L11]